MALLGEADALREKREGAQPGRIESSSLVCRSPKTEKEKRKVINYERTEVKLYNHIFR